MKRKPIAWLLAAASLLLSLSAPGVALAVEVIVNNNGPGDFGSIQAAIESIRLRRPGEPNTPFFIKVRSSTIPYTGPITPITNVPIIGDSTSDTIIAGGSPTLITVSSNVSGVSIRNFTFRSATTGISVDGNSSVQITNNVFDLGGAATAIRVQNSPNTDIVNNTFFGNGTAISTNSDVLITNNIFANNTLAIDDQTTLTLSYNDFSPIGSAGVTLDPTSIPNAARPNADPKFVDVAGRDFHLQQDSPAKGSGNPQYPNSFDSTSDMGAYGGPNSDIPLSVTGLGSTLTPPATISLSWNRAANVRVTGYRVYYGTASRDYSGTQATEGASPFVVPGAGSTSATLSNLPVTAPPAPPAPVLTVTPLNQALKLDWPAVPGASRYLVYFSTQPFDSSNLPADPTEIDGSRTTRTIDNLVNGQNYFVAVAAQAQTTIFAAVTAVVDLSLASNPGSSNESGFSNETSQRIGAPVNGPISAVVRDFPEAVSPFPGVTGEGCFIATAAYGFYSAPQVQLLREFRDRYLKNNAPGRAFVAWYYRCAPHGAQFINEHPWLKPPVRLALMPLIALALFLIKASPLAQIATLMLAAALAAGLLRRLKALRSEAEQTPVPKGGVR